MDGGPKGNDDDRDDERDGWISMMMRIQGDKRGGQ